MKLRFYTQDHSQEFPGMQAAWTIMRFAAYSKRKLYHGRTLSWFWLCFAGYDSEVRNQSDKMFQKMDGNFLRNVQRIFDIIPKMLKEERKSINNLHKTIYNFADLIYNILKMG